MGLVDKAKDALNSDKLEEASDSVLDKAEDLAKEHLDADKAKKVSELRDSVDEKLGNE
ncbi:MAG: Rv0909 family putative TA system antitoxin [Actinomycetaceae bacterium]|nr:Rv0909 family putative TA system antitoxin [Actinomycetaceae bacterium]MDY6082362.1 Rv0909 family putative TA system antitoxin [Actinomycetaceae bacterium]